MTVECTVVVFFFIVDLLSAAQHVSPEESKTTFFGIVFWLNPQCKTHFARLRNKNQSYYHFSLQQAFLHSPFILTKLHRRGMKVNKIILSSQKPKTSLLEKKESAETQGALTCQTAEGWEVFKRAVCQQKQLVSVWTLCWRSAPRQCTDEEHRTTKCQLYLTANSFLWSGTEYMKRISLLRCVWQRSLVFSTVKNIPDDHPCFNPGSEQS